MREAYRRWAGVYDTVFGGVSKRGRQMAVNMVQRALVGHYELEVRKPPLKTRGNHLIDVSVNRKKVNVMARSSYVDSE